MLDVVFKGGWLMLPIFICSVFSLAIILERLLYFWDVGRFISGYFSKITENVRKLRIKEAIEICDRKKTPITNVLKVILLHYDQPKDLIREEAEEISLYEVPNLEKNLRGLATIAHISPLLGLLGTVTGMVKCFYAIQEKTAAIGSINPADLAGGIWEALITTAAGLIVAIPAFIAYNYFVARVNFFVSVMGRLSKELTTLIIEMRHKNYEV